MIAVYNRKSFYWGIPGFIIQTAAMIVHLEFYYEVAPTLSPGNPSIAWAGALAGSAWVLGTILLLVGIIYYAKARNRHWAWCLLALIPLIIVGLIPLAFLTDRTWSSVTMKNKKEFSGRLKTSRLAICSLALGILCFITFDTTGQVLLRFVSTGVIVALGLATGILAARRIYAKAPALRGTGIARTGIIVSTMWAVALSIVFVHWIFAGQRDNNIPSIWKSSTSQTSCAEQDEQYTPKYWTIGHKAMEIESKLDGVEPNYRLMDSIIDEVKSKIKIKESYTREDAVSILSTIDNILIERDFIPGDAILLCEALKPQKVSKEVLNDIPRELVRLRALRQPDRLFYCSDCDTTSLIFLGIADALQLPIRGVHVPQHMFIRWCVTANDYFNYDPRAGGIGTDNEYKRHFNISDVSLNNGSYLRPIGRDEVLAIAFMARGTGHAENREYDQARITLTQAIKLNPRFAEAYHNRGLTWRRQGQYDKAIVDYSKAIELNPTYSQVYSNRGIAWGQMGQFDQAINDCTKAIVFDAESSQAYCNRGSIWGSMGEDKKAIADFSKAIEFNPESSEAYSNRGVVWLRMGRSDQAIEDCAKAVELDPESSEAYSNRGLVWGQMGQFDRAIADCTKAIKLNPALSQAYDVRGCNWGAKGHPDKAISDFDKAIKLNPNSYLTYRNRAVAWQMIGDYAKAKADFQKARELQAQTGEKTLFPSN